MIPNKEPLGLQFEIIRNSCIGFAKETRNSNLV